MPRDNETAGPAIVEQTAAPCARFPRACVLPDQHAGACATKQETSSKPSRRRATFHLFEVRDSDGNDCTVYDVLVRATTRERASRRLWAELRRWYPRDESDGGFGTYHACNCACEHRKRSVCDNCRESWECSHGGLLTNEDAGGHYGPREFMTEAEARAELAFYHTLVDLT
jgi:hypothetical protein